MWEASTISGGDKAIVSPVVRMNTPRSQHSRNTSNARLPGLPAIGASSTPGSFYLRVKRETEDDVRALGFSHLVIAQPSLLMGERAESRPGERAGIVVMRALDFAMFGGLRQYRAIDASAVASGMIRAMLTGEGEQVLRYDQLRG